MPAKGDNVSNGKSKLSVVPPVNGRRGKVDDAPPAGTLPALDEDLPASRKVYLEDGDIRVPVREIQIGGDNPPLRVYDTTGPQGHDVRVGLPPLRKAWVERRVARGDGNFSQMHYARRGE